MSRINQIQIRYAPIEDRIVLRLNTEDSSEFRFWITRRYAKILSASLIKLLNSTEDIQEHKEEEVQKAVMSFQHEEALTKADFAKTFQAQPKNLPLGNTPVLLSKLTVKQSADGNPMLCMYPEQGQGIDLALQQQLLHSVSKLFADALQASEWGVDFSFSQTNPAMQETEKPVLLN
ncbi:MAG: hypothetical protein GXP23_10895 [Gammaproteobacteria bacterium]|nr:hypothetical protein [Gammaproteobacteria bacterium]